MKWGCSLILLPCSWTPLRSLYAKLTLSSCWNTTNPKLLGWPDIKFIGIVTLSRGPAFKNSSYKTWEDQVRQNSYHWTTFASPLQWPCYWSHHTTRFWASLQFEPHDGSTFLTGISKSNYYPSWRHIWSCVEFFWTPVRSCNLGTGQNEQMLLPSLENPSFQR